MGTPAEAAVAGQGPSHTRILCFTALSWLSWPAGLARRPAFCSRSLARARCASGGTGWLSLAALCTRMNPSLSREHPATAIRPYTPAARGEPLTTVARLRLRRVRLARIALTLGTAPRTSLSLVSAARTLVTGAPPPPHTLHLSVVQNHVKLRSLANWCCQQ